MKAKVFAFLAGLVMLSLFFYIYLPVIRLDSLNIWFFFLLVSVGLTAILTFTRRHIENDKVAKNSRILTVVCAVVIVGGLLLSSPIINAGKYRDLIGEVKVTDFQTNIDEVEMSKLPTIDMDYARQLADKQLGNVTALGSQYRLGDGTLISMKNELYYVFPLVHGGFFEWLSNFTKGSPGYILLAANNAENIKLVEKPFQYMPEALLWQDLKRILYFSGYFDDFVTDYSFEIDDEGNPFWVVTIYDHKVYFAGDDPIGVAVMDASTGEVNRYTPEEAPLWVDRIQPVGMVLKQIDDWGNYVRGYFNFSNKEKLRLTPGYNYLYNKGQAYIYSGLTSSGGDASSVGFVLINLRTKETKFIKIGGTQETAAMGSAEEQVQAYEYTSSFPILINIDGEATYFMTLKGKEGLVKQYALVNVKNYSVVGIGDNLSQVKNDYYKKLKNAGGIKNFSLSGSQKTLKGKVLRIGFVPVEGNTNIYMIIEGSDKIFVAPYTLGDELPITKEGDIIRINYYDSTERQINMDTFDNLTF